MHAAKADNPARPLNVVVAGGGTGGHLFPGIAVAGAFAARNPASRILFVGSGRLLEKEALGRAGYPHRTISIAGIKGKGLWGKAKALFKVPGALCSSLSILYGHRADLVVAVGGYSAGPVALAAWMKGTPVVLCEQNTIPGITNRLLFPLAKRIYLSFEKTLGKIDANKKRVSGNPVRAEILQTAAEASETQKDCFTIMVVGGSQGAHAINLAVVEALPDLIVNQGRKLCFVHQTGAADEKMVATAYARAGVDAEVKAFFHDMAARYSRADLLVCRAGATTVAELTALGKVALFIPYPYAADNHQESNARAVVDAGAAEMMLESELSGARLAGQLNGLAANAELLAKMGRHSAALGRPDAAQRIVDDCYELLGV